MGLLEMKALTLPFLALGIVAGIVLLILIIFWASGNQQLLDSMLASTAEGKISSLVFTAGGPFGMWVIAMIILRYLRIGQVDSKTNNKYMKFEPLKQDLVPKYHQ